MSDETAIPVFSCASPDETLQFYETLGFSVTHRQIKPYVYLAVKRGGFDLHFVGGGRPDPEGGSGTCLVMVDDVSPHHRAFADALKARLGRVPTSGLPRITRLRRGQRRFTLVDPTGNSILFIARDEPEYEYPDKESWSKLSPMERALATAANFRDMRGNDASAARTLELALARHPDAPPLERALALAALAELSLAMGDPARARSALAELDAIPLTDAERALHRDELQAPDRIASLLG
jgi:catechol 2,3-dioxygenase-like lactoylglutathione lyase family enzyme